MTSRVETYTIGYQDRGTAQTLKVMTRLVNDSLLDPNVREYVKGIVKYANPRNNVELAQTINDWLAEHFMFLRDPSGIELLHTPAYTLGQIQKIGYFQADCDDFAILAASMVKAVGMPATFVVLEFPQGRGEFGHVYTIAKVNQKWYPFDRNVQYPPGDVSIIRKSYWDI